MAKYEKEKSERTTEVLKNELKEIRRLVEAGYSIRNVALHFDIYPQRLTKLCSKHGIKAKRTNNRTFIPLPLLTKNADVIERKVREKCVAEATTYICPKTGKTVTVLPPRYAVSCQQVK